MKSYVQVLLRQINSPSILIMEPFRGSFRPLTHMFVCIQTQLQYSAFHCSNGLTMGWCKGLPISQQVVYICCICVQIQIQFVRQPFGTCSSKPFLPTQVNHCPAGAHSFSDQFLWKRVFLWTSQCPNEVVALVVVVVHIPPMSTPHNCDYTTLHPHRPTEVKQSCSCAILVGGSRIHSEFVTISLLSK